MKQPHPVSFVSLVDGMKQPHPVSLVSFHRFTSVFHFGVSLVDETPPVSLVDGMKRFHAGVKQCCFIRCFMPARLDRVAVRSMREGQGRVLVTRAPVLTEEYTLTPLERRQQGRKENRAWCK
jgi:hypothetical protein